MQPELLERYKKMQAKFSLPHLTELKETFNLEIEDKGELFDQIRSEISDKMFSFTERIIEPLIGTPDALCCVYEQNMLTKEERERLFALYKKLQVLKWRNNLIFMNPDERNAAAWIRDTWSFWNDELKEELSHVCRRLSGGWGDLEFRKDTTNYHG